MNAKNMALMVALAASLAACKKDKDEEPEPTPTPVPHATIRLAFQFRHGALAYTLDTVLTDAAGHKVKFDDVRFFASGLHLHDDADVIIADYDGVFLLVDAASATNDFELGTVDAPHIHAVAMNVGLDDVTNHADPGSFPDPPLNDVSMHSGSTTDGYYFVVLEGWVDDNGDGVVDATDTPIEYHLMTDALLVEDEVHAHVDVVDGATMTLDAAVDMAVITASTDMLANPVTHTTDNLALAQTLMQAMVDALDE